MKKNRKTIIAMTLGVVMAVTSCQIPPKEAKAEELIKDPRIVTDSSMQAGQRVTWDCVWFGSYPQTEIVDEPDTCGNYKNTYWGNKADYEVNSSIYTALQNEAESEWDSHGDITLPDGTKYRRLKKPATHSGTGNSFHYNWEDQDTYHYFRYEPIKWRVLDREDSTALLLADKALDSQKYNPVREPLTWETSTIRSWLNGYGTTSNKQGVDYRNSNFKDTAFTSEQQGGIQSSYLTNADNTQTKTEGGNATNDNVFLLSESEVCSEAAKSYGFVYLYYYTNDEAKGCKSSTYAKAMGTWSYTSAPFTGNCRWWLRTPGGKTNNESMSQSAAGVLYNDILYHGGTEVESYGLGVRPALRLNLACSDLYSYAGTVGTNENVHDMEQPSATTTEEDHKETAGNPSPQIGQITKTGKAVNPLKIKGKTATVKYKKLKKKAQMLAVSNVITFTKKGKGTVKYTLLSARKGKKSFKKYFRINSKTGRITIKKKLKKGTYKLKIKVTAAGSSSYEAASKTVTSKIKVK